MTENEISHAPPSPAIEKVASWKRPFILFRVLQWVVAAFFALVALIMAIDIGKLSIPGAPVVLFWVALAGAIIIALIHSPPAFFKLPRVGKILAYVGVPVAIVLFGNYAGQMEAAYSKTPEGAKEAAQRAEEERQAAAERAKADARAKADQEALAREAADRKQAELEAQKPKVCQSLVSQVIGMSKSGDGPEIIEINDIAPETSIEPSEALRCSGKAITSRGELDIEFSLVTTPQGKTLISVHYP